MLDVDGLTEYAPRPAPQSFGACIRDLRVERGMTQEQLASAVGVHASYVSRVEQNVRRPSERVRNLLASALGVTQAYLAETALRDQPPSMTGIPEHEFRAPGTPVHTRDAMVGGNIREILKVTRGFSEAQWIAVVACARAIRNLGNASDI